jgi:hypothetical protein
MFDNLSHITLSRTSHLSPKPEVANFSNDGKNGSKRINKQNGLFLDLILTQRQKDRKTERKTERKKDRMKDRKKDKKKDRKTESLKSQVKFTEFFHVQ